MSDDQFEYFTAVEEHFQRARGTGYFRFSPNDWALIESWRASGTPLDAILRGIDRTFEKMRSRTEKVNSLAFCSRAIESEATALAHISSVAQTKARSFSLKDVRDFIGRNSQALREIGHNDVAAALESLDLEALYSNLEQLDQQLIAIEERVIRRLRAAATDEVLLEARHTLDRELKPYREKMPGEQLARLEKQFLERWLLDLAGLPRLSLFYLSRSHVATRSR